MGKLFLSLGILCLLYYLGIIAYAGIRASFSGIWLAAGAVFFLAAAVCILPAWREAFDRIPGILKAGAAVVLAVGLVCFLFLEGCIISGMTGEPKGQVDCLIVLGAQVRGTRVSRALQQRLDRAAAYLDEHKDTVVIVSGGQGPGEDISEAEAMEIYLLSRGISGERILKEDRSVNTEQNIRFSQELMEPGASVGIVSNDFHVFRAVCIAKAAGIEAEGLPAPSSLGMYPHYMVREAFAVAKDLIFGNMIF